MNKKLRKIFIGLYIKKKSGEELNKLKSRGFRATSLSTYDFSTLYTTFSHNLIKEKLLDLIERAFKQFYINEGTLYLACNDKKAFFTSTGHRGYKLRSCQNKCDALSYHLVNIYIRFGYKLYRKVVGIPMGTNCAPLVADFFFCERDFKTSLSDDKRILLRQFNQPHLLNIDYPYFEDQISPSVTQHIVSDESSSLLLYSIKT